MATTPRRTLIRKALSVSAIAIAATVLGASSPVASAAVPAGAHVSASPKSLLDDPAAWAAVKAAKASGYSVPDKLWASCGATH